MNIEQLSLFKQKILDGSLEICKGKVTPTQIFELANKALEEALIIDDVVGQSEQLCDNPHCQDGTVEVIYGEPLRCSNCDK